MKNKRYSIQVRVKGTYGNPGPVIDTIKRVLRAEMCGNFNPFFCTYRGEKHLVHSLEGDLSDPFRRTDSYADSLYIEVEANCDLANKCGDTIQPFYCLGCKVIEA